MNELSDYVKIARDNRKAFNPTRIPFVRIIRAKSEATRDTPWISKTDIFHLLYESEVGHIDDIFTNADKKQRMRARSIGEIQLEDVVKSSQRIVGGRKRVVFALDDSVFTRLPQDIKTNFPTLDWNALIHSLSIQESKITALSAPVRDDLASIRNFCKDAVQILSEKFLDVFDRITDNQLDNIVDDIRERRLGSSDLRPMLRKFFPDAPQRFRLAFDAFVYSFYDIVLGFKLREYLELQRGGMPELITRILAKVLETQSKDGSWSFGAYEAGLQALDTGLVLSIAALAHQSLPGFSVDRNRLESANEFLRKSVEPLHSNDTIYRCKIDNEFSRQNTLLATVFVLGSLVNIARMLQDDEVERDPVVRGLTTYLMSLQDKTGGFSKNPRERPDVESTALAVRSLLSVDYEKFDVGKRLDLLKIISFFHSKNDVIEEYIAQGILNVPMDSIRALLLCGVWPFSSYLLERITWNIDKARAHFDFIRSLKMDSSLLAGPIFDTLLAKYPEIIASIHVLHESMYCLEIMMEYQKNPEKYWEKVVGILKVSEKRS